jgi:hypothetical protein
MTLAAASTKRTMVLPFIVRALTASALEAEQLGTTGNHHHTLKVRSCAQRQYSYMASTAQQIEHSC